MKLAVALGAGMVWATAFSLVAWGTSFLPAHGVMLPADAWVKPQVAWAPVYFLAYFAALPAIFRTTSARAFLRLLLAVGLASVLAFLCYGLFPTRFDRPAPEFWGAGWLADFHRWQLQLEPALSANNLPSLHVALPVVMALAAWSGRRPREAWAMGLFSGLLAFSTLALRQHVLLDVIGALLLAPLAWGLAGLLLPVLVDENQTLLQGLAHMLKRLGWMAIFTLIFVVAVPGSLLALALRMQTLAPLPALPAWAHMPAWLLAIGGGLWTLLAMRTLIVRGAGLPVSAVPPARWVTGGLYRHFRHPIYSAFTWMFAGVCLLQDYWAVLIALPTLVLSWVAYARCIEEPALTRRLGVTLDQGGWLLPAACERPIASALRPAGTLLMRAMQVLADRPVWWQRGPHLLVGFGPLVGLGAIAGMFGTFAALCAQGVPENTAALMVLGGTGLAVIGSYLFWYAGNFRTLWGAPRHGLGRIGFISFGALPGMALFPLLLAWRGICPLPATLDTLFCFSCLTYAIGRLGCISYGCCFGMQSSHGLCYRHPQSKPVRLGNPPGQTRWPSQALHAAAGLVLFGLLMGLAGLRPPPGTVLGLGLCLYGWWRAALECSRERQPVLGRWVTPGHLGAIAMLLGGALLLVMVPAGPVGGWSLAPAHWQAAWRWSPAFLAVGLLVALAQGYHRKEVGQWI